MKDVAQKLKKALKEKLPEYTFSVTSDYNSITVAVMSGPAALPEHQQLNHHQFGGQGYYTERERYPESYRAIFCKVEEILEGLRKNETESEDSDYGSIPNYYKHYHIGKWDKPYKQKLSEASAEEMMNDFNWVGSRHHY